MTVALFVMGTTASAQASSGYQSPANEAKSRDTTVTRTLGAFVDGYYAWDFDRPHTFDRLYTTQPARHGEFNINLAYLEAKVAGPRYRGRLAVQYGTSVQANYAGEPRVGVVSGPGVSQFIQEAVAGYQLGPTLWLDGGIFFAHLGYESWISRDNLTYTRSMVADFSPYYEAGAKLTWTASPRFTGTAAIVNGWQNIAAENSTPAGGIRLDYKPTSEITLTYDNFIGNSAPDSIPERTRLYHDVVAQYNPDSSWQFAAVYSIGSQSRSTPSNGTASWWGMTSIGKYRATSTLSLVGRFEVFRDPSQVLVVTGLPRSFQTTAASLGIDVAFAGPLLWRTEGRYYWSRYDVWPLHSVSHFGSNDSFIVTSLALTF
jgi:hypothetical protein